MSTALEPTPTIAPTEPRQDGASPWLPFAAIVSAVILNILDSTLISVAGPSIRADLRLSAAGLEWAAAAYTLALAVGLLAGARLGDMVGRRRVWLVGLTGFVVCSVLCSLAWSGDALVVFRAAQGLCAALVLPQCFGQIRDLFGERMGQAMGAMGPVIGLATVAGPVVAGLLTDADLLGTGWRAIFWINVPLGVFGLVVGARRLPRVAPTQAGVRLDLVGTALVALAAFCLVFPLVEGRGLGWPAWVWAVLALALPLFAAFVAQQRRRVRTGRFPLLEVSVLRKRSYVAGVVFIVVFFAVVVGFNLVVGLFLQVGLGFTPLRASLYLTALAVGTFAGSGVGAWAAQRVGRPILHVGLLVMALGACLLWVSLVGGGGTSGVWAPGFWALAPGLAVFGLGMGQIFVPLFGIVMGDVDDREVGSASGLLSSAEQLGASLGVAVLGSVFFGTLRIEEGGPTAVVASGRHLLAAEHTLVWVAGVCALAWALGWVLPRRAAEQGH